MVELDGRVGPEALAHPDAGRQPVDGVAACDHAYDEPAPLSHELDRLRGKLDPLPAACDPHDLVDRQAAPRQRDRHPQTARAVSASSSSFARWSSGVSAFPSIEVAKPHCGEIARRSAGT